MGYVNRESEVRSSGPVNSDDIVHHGKASAHHQLLHGTNLSSLISELKGSKTNVSDLNTQASSLSYVAQPIPLHPLFPTKWLNISQQMFTGSVSVF